MDKESRILLLIIIVVAFIGTFAVGIVYYWPHSVESTTVGFDEEWKMGSDVEIGTAKGSWRIIPLLDFEHNGINYTTHSNIGLPVDLVFVEKNALMSAGNGRTFQGFYIRKDHLIASDDDIICALYAIVENNRVYYTTEELYSKRYYKFTFEQRNNKAIVNHHPNTSSFFLEWLMFSFGAAFIVFFVVVFSTEYKKDTDLNR